MRSDVIQRLYLTALVVLMASCGKAPESPPGRPVGAANGPALQAESAEKPPVDFADVIKQVRAAQTLKAELPAPPGAKSQDGKAVTTVTIWCHAGLDRVGMIEPNSGGGMVIDFKTRVVITGSDSKATLHPLSDPDDKKPRVFFQLQKNL